MKKQSLKDEEWREYEFKGVIYRIVDPVALWVGSTTHRIIDEQGVIHCVPAVGYHGCILRWKPRFGTIDLMPY